MLIKNKNQFRTNFLILVFFLLLNFSTTGGHLFSIDDVQYYLHTENIALNHSIQLNPYSPSASKLVSVDSLRQMEEKQYISHGKEWSDNTSLSSFYDAASLLLPFATVPLYYISTILSSDPTVTLPFFTNSIIISLVALMIFVISNHLLKSERLAFTISLIYMVTTFIWPYNTGMMLRPLSSLMLLCGFYLILTTSKENYHRSFVAGICVSLTMLAEASAVILLPGVFVFGLIYLRKYKKNVLLFLVGFVLIITLQGVLNEIRFGSFTDFGFGFQQDITTHSHVDGIIGYIFSLGWGIIFNAPLLILFPPSVYLAWKKNKVLGLFLLYCFVITWIFHGTEVSPIWSGYGGWGPRYFNIILPLLMISTGFFMREYLEKKAFKISFVGLAIFGFFVNFLGKLVWYWYGYSYGWAILKTQLMVDSWNRMNYDIHYAPIALHLYILNSNYLQSLTNGWGLGLAPCQYDLFIYCKFGILPFISILVMLAIVGYLVLLFLNNSKKDITSIQ